jgi:hypothetical protein
MSDSPQESQKCHLSKIRPHGLVNVSTFTNVYAHLLAFIVVYLRQTSRVGCVAGGDGGVARRSA